MTFKFTIKNSNNLEFKHSFLLCSENARRVGSTSFDRNELKKKKMPIPTRRRFVRVHLELAGCTRVKVKYVNLFNII